MFLTLYLTAMGGTAVCLAVSARFSVYSVAHLTVTFIFVLMMVSLRISNYAAAKHLKLNFAFKSLKYKVVHQDELA